MFPFPSCFCECINASSSSSCSASWSSIASDFLDLDGFFDLAGFSAGGLLHFTTLVALGLTVGGVFGCNASDAAGFLLSDVFGFFDGFVELAVLFRAV